MAFILQAIETGYIGPGNVRGARIKAKSYARSIYVPYDHALNIENNHAAAAGALAEKMGWSGRWYQGGSPDGSGYYFVCVDGGSSATFVVSKRDHRKNER